MASSQYTARGSGAAVASRTVTPTTVSPRRATAKPGAVYASSPMPGSGCWRRAERMANWAGMPRSTITISATRPSGVQNCAVPNGSGPAAAPPRTATGTPSARLTSSVVSRAPGLTGAAGPTACGPGVPPSASATSASVFCVSGSATCTRRIVPGSTTVSSTTRRLHGRTFTVTLSPSHRLTSVLGIPHAVVRSSEPSSIAR